MKKSVFIPFGLKCKFMKYRILFLLILFCSFPLAAKSYITIYIDDEEENTSNDYSSLIYNEPAVYLNFSWIHSDSYKGKNLGICFSYKPEKDNDYLYADYLYGGLGADFYWVDLKDEEEKGVSGLWSIDFRMGACYNYSSFRPYIEGGIGGYPWGLFLCASLGFDFFLDDSYTAGAYYSLKNFRGESVAHCFGFKIGFHF